MSIYTEDLNRYGVASCIGSFQRNLKEFEKVWLAKTMQETNMNQTRAAIKMGWSRNTLRTKLQEYFPASFPKESRHA